jgi:hypothetical protein
MPSLRPIAAASVSLSVMALHLGCGGAEFVLDPGDAADSGRGPSTNASEGGADATAAYCQSLSAYYSRCHFNATCYRINLVNCDSFALSDAVRSAFLECQSNLQCTQAGDVIRQSCVSSALAAAPPTPAQIQLAADYCAACALPGTVCDTRTFFKEGITSTGDGPGFLARLYNDTIATSIDTQCLSTGAVGCASLGICEDVILSQVTGDACTDGG